MPCIYFHYLFIHIAKSSSGQTVILKMFEICILLMFKLGALFLFTTISLTCPNLLCVFFPCFFYVFIYVVFLFLFTYFKFSVKPVN